MFYGVNSVIIYAGYKNPGLFLTAPLIPTSFQDTYMLMKSDLVQLERITCRADLIFQKNLFYFLALNLILSLKIYYNKTNIIQTPYQQFTITNSFQYQHTYNLISLNITSLLVTHITIVAMIQLIQNKKVNIVSAVLFLCIFAICSSIIRLLSVCSNAF